MHALRFSLLSEPSRPLLNKFYRGHKSPMRASSDARLWVAKQADIAEIIGALCLTAIADGHWLTGLFVAPAARGQGVARRLLDEALAHTHGPVWLFCHPDLLSFYQRAGFGVEVNLPETLADRFERYSRTKALIALNKPRVQP